MLGRLWQRLARWVNIEWRWTDFSDVPFPGDEDEDED